MRMVITLEFVDKFFILPIDYNHIIQSFIYRNISSELASFLHERGYTYGKRSFKLFTFSRLFGEFKLNKENIEFRSPVRLYIASAETRFIQELAETLLKSKNIKLGKQSVEISSIEISPNKNFGREVLIKTLSPITVYSTLHTKDGKKKTYYYFPYEKEFSELIFKNLKKKFKLVYGKEPGRRELLIEPLDRKSISQRIVKYKGTIVKGWMGRFRLKGSPDLISLGYDTGLGSKNSQGFGMFEVIER